MTWDAWTFAVLGLFLLAVLRPAWAIAAQRHVRPTAWRRQHLQRAGGGAAMLTIAVYLVTQSRQVIGQGYWDLVLLAVHTPFMRLLPVVWVLRCAGFCWWSSDSTSVYRGAKELRGPRNSMIAVWAANEMLIIGGLLWWGVLVPDTCGRLIDQLRSAGPLFRLYRRCLHALRAGHARASQRCGPTDRGRLAFEIETLARPYPPLLAQHHKARTAPFHHAPGRASRHIPACQPVGFEASNRATSMLKLPPASIAKWRVTPSGATA